MNAETWQRAKSLLADALECEPMERDAFLRSRCSDPDRLRQVQSLLAAADPVDEDMAPAAAPLVPGTRFGAYEIVDVLGRGGMGEVYRARDDRLAREVAVKILPAAFATDRQ